MTITWPMVQWLAVTVHAISAIIQPPITALQKMWEELPTTDFIPKPVRPIPHPAGHAGKR